MPMYAHARSWSKCKWLIAALPLILSGCGNQDTDRARELQTRMDEAQVQVEAQAARIASLERTLAVAVKASREADSRRRALSKEQLARARQVKILQQQRQALLLDQRNLRQALGVSNAALRRTNQQLLFVGQQNRFLQQRVNTLDLWLRQQSALAQAQYMELAALREARKLADAPGQKLDADTAKRGSRMNHMQYNRKAVAEKIRVLHRNLAEAIDHGRRLSGKIDQLQRTRAYLADKLSASEKQLAELRKTPR